MTKPLVSVVMAAYNGQEYLNIAIDSMLQQTYSNFELILIDDGSTDNTANIVENYTDKRIRYIHQSNRGLAAALNHGIQQARGQYIARMDCDDISYPTRLAEQVAFLEKNKTIGLVGTSFDLVDENGRIIDRSIHLDAPGDLQLEFLVRNPFGHGTIMIRKKALDAVGPYDTNQTIEDYELWWRFAQKYPVANIPKQLYGWRVVPSSMSHGSDKKRQQYISQLMKDIWSKYARLSFSKQTVSQSLQHYAKLGPKYQEQYVYFLAALCAALRKKKRYIEAAKLYRILLTLPKSRASLKDIQNNPRSHNYNLVNIGR